MPNTQLVLVLHFGGPLASFVARRIRNQQVFCEVVPSNASLDLIKGKDPIGIVLAGESYEKYPCDPQVYELGKPLFTVKQPEDTEGLHAFLFDTCHGRADWNMEMFIEDAIQEIRQQVGSGRVLLGLSGGVDSAVCAALIHKAIGDQLSCVFVNHGLMRKGEPESVHEVFTGTFGMNLVSIDASARFFEKLKGITDPEAKRKIIGGEFIGVFAKEALRLGRPEYLAQGTIYPDIIESGSAPGDEVIKSHHNVGGLPDHIDFVGLVEPLRMLFKDEVRAVGTALGLPDHMVHRQPFPGPGLGVRVIGELTPERVEVERQADAIFREELEAAGLGPSISQYFTVLTGVKSVGVRNGKRAHDDVICLRAVHTTDFMEADWVRLPYEVIDKISRRITREIPTVSRVVLDVTSKPPASIEWE